jgi:hypothetical protein
MGWLAAPEADQTQQTSSRPAGCPQPESSRCLPQRSASHQPDSRFISEASDDAPLLGTAELDLAVTLGVKNHATTENGLFLSVRSQGDGIAILKNFQPPSQRSFPAIAVLL